jgi:BNR repeat protein
VASTSSRHRTVVQKTAIFLLCIAAVAQAAPAAPDFSPQKRVGYSVGDQWEPSLAADGHGHVYILYPQYGSVPDCPGCTSPAVALLLSNDNGISWQPSRVLLPFMTGQFDPQIVVDPADRQTIYASWLQNNKRDVIVARSMDFGRTWSFSIADRARDETDKPVLTVHGADVYVGFNHEERFFVSASHDGGQTFSGVQVNPSPEPGWSLAGGATVDSGGNVFFGWTQYSRHDMPARPVEIFVSRSADGGRTWNTTLLDASSAPPACDAQACGTGYLGPQIALASDVAGTVYALWNAGAVNGGPERMYFSSSTTAGASWSARKDVSAASRSVESCFPAISAAGAGDVRIAWMDTRMTDGSNHPVWNTFYRSSTNGGATWSPETKLSGPAPGYDYIVHTGFRFPFGDYFMLAIDNQGTTHAAWGEGRNYKSPGSIWYTHGR